MTAKTTKQTTKPAPAAASATMTIQVAIQPFVIPPFVVTRAPEGQNAQRHMRFAQHYPLSSLSAETLDGMCSAFRTGVFEAAGKTDPKAAT